ncbi:NAD(P)(+) transhydrogenase (Re/Si-specific) subunit beta [Membranihabitans marinus]|uniref:NAD(P)(+) transhydrogenase (Re/Si-specific) subunit beta n=1 Tax=Membranihabitans marinus TaxID=1227546 RepID=UPI001F29C183|nr:NAD(P)(+) transhydrogenase (Re/Si-specific) subunit beta [Membranihabitans marinus]
MESLVSILYMIAVFAFAYGIRMMRSPKTAKQGNVISLIGMLLGLLGSLIQPLPLGDNNYLWIVMSMFIGSAIGLPLAQKVKMTAMPQLVAMFNGLGGASATVIGIVELLNINAQTPFSSKFISVLALLIGAISFTGSILAYLKLEGKLRKQWVVPGHNALNLLLLVIMFGLGILIATGTNGIGWPLWVMLALSLFYGVFFVFPIGGADMPVVISLLNSLTGLSAAAAGGIYGNKAMLIGGILVGASGTILTLMMCQAMNRSLWNVILAGKFTAGSGASSNGTDQVMKEITKPDAAILMQYSKNVLVIPGYGLAVSQAQKIVKEMDDLLGGVDVSVKYAIHPVAGRMPGHMNVLLAEADVPYEKLLDLDDANAALKNTDVVLIIGANDVVNPSANDDPGSPIYGMPILNALDAKHVIVMKRGRGAGYSGIENPLFYHDKTKLYFGDAKASLNEIIAELKENL